MISSQLLSLKLACDHSELSPIENFHVPSKLISFFRSSAEAFGIFTCDREKNYQNEKNTLQKLRSETGQIYVKSYSLNTLVDLYDYDQLSSLDIKLLRDSEGNKEKDFLLIKKDFSIRPVRTNRIISFRGFNFKPIEDESILLYIESILITGDDSCFERQEYYTILNKKIKNLEKQYDYLVKLYDTFYSY